MFVLMLTFQVSELLIDDEYVLELEDESDEEEKGLGRQ
jgi:hypothetical protein